MGYFEDIKNWRDTDIKAGRDSAGIGEVEIRAAKALESDFYSAGSMESVGKAHEEVSITEDGKKITSLVLDNGDVAATAEEQEIKKDGRKIAQTLVTFSGKYLTEEEYLQEVEKGPSSQERDDSAYFAEREHDAAGRVIFLQVNDTGKTISYNDDGSVRTTTDILPAEGFIRRLTDSVRTEYDDRGIVVSQRFVTHKRTGDSEERYGCEIRTVDYEHDKNGRRIPKKETVFVGMEGDSQPLQIDSKTVCEYKDGVPVKKTEESYERDETKDALNITRNELTYDDKGRIKTETKTFSETDYDQVIYKSSQGGGYFDLQTRAVETVLEKGEDGKYRKGEDRRIVEDNKYSVVKTYYHKDKMVKQTISILENDESEKYRIEKDFEKDGSASRRVYRGKEMISEENGSPDSWQRLTFRVEYTEKITESHNLSDPIERSRITEGTRERAAVSDDNGRLVLIENSVRDKTGQPVFSEEVSVEKDGSYSSRLKDRHGEVRRAIEADKDGTVLKDERFEGAEERAEKEKLLVCETENVRVFIAEDSFRGPYTPTAFVSPEDGKEFPAVVTYWADTGEITVSFADREDMLESGDIEIWGEGTKVAENEAGSYGRAKTSVEATSPNGEVMELKDIADAVEAAEKLVAPVKTIERANELSEIRSYTIKSVAEKAEEKGIDIGSVNEARNAKTDIGQDH